MVCSGQGGATSQSRVTEGTAEAQEGGWAQHSLLGGVGFCLRGLGAVSLRVWVLSQGFGCCLRSLGAVSLSGFGCCLRGLGAGGVLGILPRSLLPQEAAPISIFVVFWGPQPCWLSGCSSLSRWELPESHSWLNLASTNIKGKVSAEFVPSRSAAASTLPIPWDPPEQQTPPGTHRPSAVIWGLGLRFNIRTKERVRLRPPRAAGKSPPPLPSLPAGTQ